MSMATRRPSRRGINGMRTASYQYRVLWRYKGRKTEMRKVSERIYTILKMLRRLIGTEPWMGANSYAIKRGWVNLMFRLDVPWEVVKDLSPREVMLKIQQSYPDMDYLRVEYRQVGPWVEMLDPKTNLRTPSVPYLDAKWEKYLEKVEGMTPEELDRYRLIPSRVYKAPRTYKP